MEEKTKELRIKNIINEAAKTIEIDNTIKIKDNAMIDNLYLIRPVIDEETKKALEATNKKLVFTVKEVITQEEYDKELIEERKRIARSE